MNERIETVRETIRQSILDEKKRISLQFRWIYGILMVIAAFMTVVNVLTGKRLLMYATLLFAVLCCINLFLARINDKALYVTGWIFSLELIVLLTFFIISGTPEGFSAIWACMLSTCGLLLFQRKRGTMLCAVMFIIIVFLFETNLGNSLLQYSYTDSFKLRFPMLYLAFFAVSFLLESIRLVTFEEMKKAQEKYEYLYRHDALTKVYNRYGFNERMDELLSARQDHSLALLILDLDHFKRINDTYGHLCGDEVLKRVASLLVEMTGDDADVCRWGGEEFAILFSGNKKAEENGKLILEALRALPIPCLNETVWITASIGIAEAESCEDLDPGFFVRLADTCLYQAKESGRNTLVYHHLSQPMESCQAV